MPKPNNYEFSGVGVRFASPERSRRVHSNLRAYLKIIIPAWPLPVSHFPYGVCFEHQLDQIKQSSHHAVLHVLHIFQLLNPRLSAADFPHFVHRTFVPNIVISILQAEKSCG